MAIDARYSSLISYQILVENRSILFRPKSFGSFFFLIVLELKTSGKTGELNRLQITFNFLLVAYLRLVSP